MCYISKRMCIEFFSFHFFHQWVCNLGYSACLQLSPYITEKEPAFCPVPRAEMHLQWPLGFWKTGPVMYDNFLSRAYPRYRFHPALQVQLLFVKMCMAGIQGRFYFIPPKYSTGFAPIGATLTYILHCFAICHEMATAFTFSHGVHCLHTVSLGKWHLPK